MARRKNTEVLITGEKVDSRERLSVNKDVAGGKPVAADVAPQTGQLGRRPRKVPKVIDLLDGKQPMPGSATGGGSLTDDLAALERELGMQPTAAPGEGVGPALSLPVAPRKPERDTNWEEIQRTKKVDHDLPPQSPSPPKPAATDAFALSTPVAPKPKADIKTPVTPLSNQPTVKPKRVNRVSPKAQSKAIAETVVSSILDRIKVEAQKRGGQLSLANIDEMRAEFDGQTLALSAAFEQSFEAYIQARERAAWDTKRDFPFDRLIVKKFSHLFSEKRVGRFDRVSRRMLPGFFMALGMMLGPDIVDDLQGRCHLIVEQLKEEQGDHFDWADAYESEQANAIVLDALVPVARHFEDFEKRREWFIALVNGHLTAVQDSEKNDAGWELTTAGFDRFLTALLQDLSAVLQSENDRPRIVKRYGADAVNAVIRVEKALKKSKSV